MSHPVNQAIDHPQVRAIERISLAYTVAVIEEVLSASPFDTLDTMMLSVITVRNLRPVTEDVEMSRRYADWSHPVPDEVREPISRRALAASLSLPLETVRRRVDRLEKFGIIKEVEGGVIVAGGVEGTAAMMAPLFNTKFELLRRMLTQFRAHGIDIASEVPTDIANDIARTEPPPSAASPSMVR